MPSTFSLNWKVLNLYSIFQIKMIVLETILNGRASFHILKRYFFLLLTNYSDKELAKFSSSSFMRQLCSLLRNHHYSMYQFREIDIELDQCNIFRSLYRLLLLVSVTLTSWFTLIWQIKFFD